jgi:hypothetical protein
MKDLIAQYQSKILLMDKTIEACTSKIRSFRHDDLTTTQYNFETQPIVEDRKIAESKRQCYVQFIVDIESI